ncbi:hypothetical protein E2986_11077 [Frieseomelitta varia]|uniref:Zinc transporter ZIP3 n=1 Tax=Frieseomelitta varia TaxID=561572 RepID=A0A833RVH1_9HYME|nr:hypothetical protein E2986_11077 [Frieseomelitta varia]
MSLEDETPTQSTVHPFHEDQDNDQDVLVAKGVTMVILCTVSIIMGIVPMQVAKQLKWNTSGVENPRSMRLVSLLLGFGGGVLFCTTFLHLLPEVKEGLEHLTAEGKLPELSFSLAETLTCAGFFIMYLVEESVHTHLRKKQTRREGSSKDVTKSTNELVENGQTLPNCVSGHSHYSGYMFAAVAAHKFVIAFCIGMELIASNTRRYLSVIYVCTFAVVSPLGIGIGMCLVGGESAAANGIFPVLLQGLASGTLLYVVFFEILQEHRTGLYQYLSILLGFAVMFGLQILTRSTTRFQKIYQIFPYTNKYMEEATMSTVLLVAKIGAMVGLGFGSLLLGMLPLIVGRYRMNHRQKRHRGIFSNSSTCTSTSVSNASSSSVISGSATNSQGLQTSLLLCFGGGVLLFTTFLHLAPEVRVNVERHQTNGQLPTLGTLNLSELLFCAGFFLVYFVEEAVHAALTGKPDSSEALLYRTVSVRRCNNQTGGSTATNTGSTTTVSTITRSTWKEGNDESKDSENESSKRSSRLEHGLDDQRDGKRQDKVLPAIFVLSSSMELSSAQHSAQDTARYRDTNYPGTKHQHEHSHAAMTKNSSVQGLLTVLALSFHAIFEGLAVGLEPSIGSVVYLAAAIATHKLVISFCVGMELYVAGASTRTTLGYLTIFSMVTPIGIAVGLALGHFKNDSENLGPTPTILQGMAAGTLLYVVFFEVLARERANEKSGLLQLTAIIVGFMLMLGLQIANVHSHEVDHHQESDHNHELDSHEHIYPNEMSERILTDKIYRVTESIAETVSNVLSSTMKTSTDTPFRSSSNETALHTNRS